MREDLVSARNEHVQRLNSAGLDLYPTWKGWRDSVSDVREHSDEFIESKKTVIIGGRLMGMRKHGGSAFVDVREASGQIQGWLKKDIIGDSYDLLDSLDLGDFIKVEGSVVKTKAGELTIEAQKWELLSKSVLPLADTWAGLKDVETRARQRELDLIMNEESRNVFIKRSAIIGALRDFLRENGFTEVETPILQAIPGGTSARPFKTHHNALDIELFLRIAPELYLKKLVVGGIERVFEIGKSFRNEGVDKQHNPEFTSCEFYMAYSNLDDLLELSQKLFEVMIRAAGNELKFEYQGKEIDFSYPWKQASFVEMMKKDTGIDVLKEERVGVYEEFLKKNGMDLPEVKSVPVLVDTLYKEVIRKKTWNPLVVRDFPVWMEPLAKRNDDNPQLVQRGQLLAANMEIFKAFTELNDPMDQEARFMEQERMREQGDPEAQRIDQTFLRALKYGLPPTAGWGMGIDRIVMLLTNQAHIRDVINFPLLKPE